MSPRSIGLSLVVVVSISQAVCRGHGTSDPGPSASPSGASCPPAFTPATVSGPAATPTALPMPPTIP